MSGPRPGAPTDEHPEAGRLVGAVRWCVAPGRRGFTLAVLTGLALRVGWVLWAGAAEPLEPFSDAGRNLTMARQFADLQTYRLNGLVSAYNPPGYPLLLTPVAALSRATGWFGLPLGAALVNVGAGTATVALGGALADRWFGPRARTAAAWLLAVAAGPIYLTLVSLSETMFTALVLTVLLVVSGWILGTRPVGRRALVAVGAMIGLCALVRPPGLLLVLVAAFALRGRRGSWRAAARPALAVGATAALVLVPWTVRNAVQVDVVTLVATNGAAFVCQGHGPDAKADVDDMTQADFAYCFRHSPFDPVDPDEAAWAPRIQRRALAWAVTHPREELALTWAKTYATLANDRQAMDDALDGNRRTIAADDTMDRLRRLAERWHQVVLAGGLLAVALLPAARRAWPLWATAAGFVAVVWAGNALDRYHHTTMALLAVLAGAALASLRPIRAWRSVTMSGGRRRDRIKERRAMGQAQRDEAVDEAEASRDRTDEPAAPADEAPPAPAEGLAQAARPAGPWAGPYGRPFHPMVAAVAIGAWVCAFGFDLISQVADTAWVYARGAYVLTGAGVLAGAVAATVGLADLVRVPRGTVAFRTGVRHLLLMDACLVLFAVSFLIRRGSDFAWHDPVEPLASGVSIVGLGALVAGTWLGSRLAHTYGVRVAVDEDRRRGFEADR